MIPALSVALLLQVVSASQDTTTGRPCRVAVDSMGHYAESTNPAGEKTTNGGGGVLAHCAGTGTTISADSFAHYGTLGRLDLIGRVQIRDTALALDAHYASYFLKDERLEAHNNVVAVHRLRFARSQSQVLAGRQGGSRHRRDVCDAAPHRRIPPSATA